MAITWTESKPSTNGWGTEVKTWTTHEGLVVSESWSQCDRVMSDIYADGYYVNVWNPETQAIEKVCLGHAFELCMRHGHATVDADASILAEVARQAEAARIAREQADKAAAEDRARKAAEIEFNRPRKGLVMQVTRGRKVRKGTVGRVFWLDDLRHPSRVGLALSDRKDARGNFAEVAWVNAEYLENTDPAGPDYAAYGLC